MLQSLRNGTKSPIMRAFLLFLAGGFAIWGIGDVSTGLFGSGDKAVRAGDRSVSIYEAATEFELIRRSSLGGLNTGQALQAGLLDEVIGQLSRKTVFAAEADTLKLDVTRDMLRIAVAKEPAFQNEFGEFAEGRFLQLLAQNGFTEEAFLARLEDSLIIEQLVDSVVSGAAFSADLATALAQYQLEERSASILRFAITPDAIAAPDEAALAAWFTDAQPAYRAPALRDIEVLSLHADDIAAMVELDEAEIKLAYDTRLDEFVTPERRTVRQMVFGDLDAANKAAAALTDIAEFNLVAETELGWTENDVSLGDVARDDLDTAFGDAVFTAEAGTLIGPVETAFGYNLGVVDTITEGGQKSLDEVRGAIETSLRTEAAITALYDLVTEIEDSLGAGATLGEAAAGSDMQITTISGLSRLGRTIDGTAYSGALAELASDSNFLTEAWEMEIGEVSTVVEASPDSYFVVKPIAEMDARDRTLDEVRDRAITDWKAEQAIAAAIAEAEAAQANGEASFAAAEATEMFQRSGAGIDSEAARLIARAAFDQEIGASQVVETGTEVLVVKTDAVQAADTEAVSDFVTNLAANFDQLVVEDIGTALAITLSETHGLETYPASVRQLLVTQAQ